MNKIKLLLIGLAFVLVAPILLMVSSAQAQTFKSGDLVNVPVGQTVDSAVFLAGNTVEVAGNVNGDVYCAGQNVVVSGRVNGDVLCAGQTVTVSGVVNGDVRLGGQTVLISGKVSQSASIFAQTLTVSEAAVIASDITGGVQTATFNGQVGRDVVLGANQLSINGVVGRNITSGVTTLTLGSKAQVGGNIDYTSANQLTQNPGAVVKGTVTRNDPPEDKQNETTGAFGVALFSFFTLGLMLSLLLFALVVVLVIPQRLQAGTDFLVHSWPKTLLIGVVAHLAVPVVVVGLLLTVIGIPLAIFLMLLWWAVLLLSGPFAAYALGRLLLKNQTKNAIWYMLAGAGIVLVAYLVPFLNLLALLVVGVFGVGMTLAAFVPPKPHYTIAHKKR